MVLVRRVISSTDPDAIQNDEDECKVNALVQVCSPSINQLRNASVCAASLVARKVDTARLAASLPT